MKKPLSNISSQALIIIFFTLAAIFFHAVSEAASRPSAPVSYSDEVIKKIECIGQNTYKFYFKLENQSIISAYLSEPKSGAGREKPLKIYELFTNKILMPADSECVQINFTDAFKKYSIIEKNDETNTYAAFAKEKAGKYGVMFEIAPAVHVEKQTIGMQGRSSGLLSSPRGLSCDSSGNIFVADYGNDRIQKFDQSGHFIFEFGSFAWDEKNTSTNNVGTSNAATFNEPVGVAVTNKNIFVSERGNNRIQKFDRDGNFLLIFGGEGNTHGRLSAPGGVACDSSNYVWVCDTKNDRVQKFDQNGNFMLEIGGFGSGEGKFNEPIDLAIDSKNNIYVLDARNKRVVICDEYGNIKSAISLEKLKGMNEATGVAVFLDRVVLVSVVFEKNSRIVAFSVEGDFLGFIGGDYERLSSIAASHDGDIYVSETARHKILKFSLPDEKNTHNINLLEFCK